MGSSRALTPGRRKAFVFLMTLYDFIKSGCNAKALAKRLVGRQQHGHFKECLKQLLSISGIKFGFCQFSLQTCWLRHQVSSSLLNAEKQDESTVI